MAKKSLKSHKVDLFGVDLEHSERLILIYTVPTLEHSERLILISTVPTFSIC